MIKNDRTKKTGMLFPPEVSDYDDHSEDYCCPIKHDGMHCSRPEGHDGYHESSITCDAMLRDFGLEQAERDYIGCRWE